ncbi:hypothetical protein E1B28_003720 [Marasmius oreades]|uniref:T6SS Phospholipase effector Tle1-like catalytic domain-containing protein n=1 Tax=Marasmius oreades TaxID=181124 RepID=A0A9P7UX46_9AGAR|nr:uncharacterized protein E1B28_003720 [Marasmius oreades]KAG7096272.1 hypothetical protein E1B28_003720 [Marasmius oreades]
MRCTCSMEDDFAGWPLPTGKRSFDMAPKTLLVFCDGTGKDGTLASPMKSSEMKHLVSDMPGFDIKDLREGGASLDRKAKSAASDGGGHTEYATNVLRLSRSVLPQDKNGNRQIVYYQSGVGSEADFAGSQVTGAALLQALGTAVASKVRDAYAFIAQNFADGDEICLFGFSRGAYTARKLSGLIDAIGLLSRKNLSYFFEIWRQLIEKEPITKFPDTRFPDIKCVGVWDTVGSVFNEINALNIKDTSLPATVKVALHAVSLQENREVFLPTLWSFPSGGLKDGQVLKQVWFPGAHSDIGGGYKRHELADISVYWMAGEIEEFVNLDVKFLRSFAQPNPDPWGTSQPHNAYMETKPEYQFLVGHETRLESLQITKESMFHESIRFSPQKLDSPDSVITMTIIKEEFGSGFEPQYSPLNDFEQYCKDHWGVRGILEARHGIEDPEAVWGPRIVRSVPI